jgi:AcrR family transcriptional regulator
MATSNKSARRERLHENTRAEIKATARAQMARDGTAGLSLNAIARAMEISAPALYRYFASRDDLITALVIDAYHDLAASLEQADTAHPPAQHGDRLLAVMTQYRAWAKANPTDFQLIFGNPIPGYVAPVDQTLPAARRALRVIIGIFTDAQRAGVAFQQPMPPGAFSFQLPLVPDDPASGPLPQVILYSAISGWARMHGLVMLELFNHLPMVAGDFGAFYASEMVDMVVSLGLTLSHPQA